MTAFRSVVVDPPTERLPFDLSPDAVPWVPVPTDGRTAGRVMGVRDLRRLGDLVLRSWRAGRSPAFDLLSGKDTLVTAAARMGECSVAEAAALIASQFEELGDITEQTRTWLFRESANFFERLRLQGFATLDEVSQTEALAFIDEPYVTRAGAWCEPAPPTRSKRRTAIRLVFQTARQLHIASGDPTQDILIDRNGSRRKRPLEDGEELLGRSASRSTLHETRHPAGWALGQATATSGEIGVAEIRDLRLDDSEVLLRGHKKRLPRVGRLTEWGVQRLRERVDQLDGPPETRLITGTAADGPSAQSYSCGVVHDVMKWALLAGEPGVEPNSLAAWAGRRVFESSGRIEDAAKALGVRSLDNAASIIGWDAWS